MRNYELKLVDSSRLLADILVTDIGSDPDRFDEMMDLSLRDDYPLSMRAARVIALAGELYPELLVPYLSIIITKLDSIKTDGVRRSFLKLLAEQSYVYSDEELGILTDLSFTWLTDPREAIAIRYYAIEILLMVSNQYPEIRNELKNILHEMLDDVSSGLKAKSIKVLNYLKKL